MVVYLAKQSGKQLSENLNSREVDCKCEYEHCRHTMIDVNVIEAFEELRESVGEALIITSGYRCGRHNDDVAGKSLSRHKLGQSLDIKCPEGMRFDVFEKKCRAIFPFVLNYKHLNFCHCDVGKR